MTEPAESGGERQSEIEIIYEQRDQGVADRNLLGPLMLFQRSDLKDDLCVCLARWFAMYSEHHQPFRLYFSAVDSSNDSTLEEKLRQLTEALETLDKALNDSSERGLSERIIRLAKPFGGSLGTRRSIEDLGKIIADTRNELVHHAVKKGRQGARGPDLLRLTYQCELLLIYCLTSVVTGSPRSALEMIKGKQAVAKRLRVIED
ncbi:MAG: hypothetical protein OXG27_13905 [Chloroflexi bacterium]|nr:hypothetical protein [Chloroflexota bacterium]